MEKSSKAFTIVVGLCAAMASVILSVAVLPLVIPWHFGGNTPAYNDSASQFREGEFFYYVRPVRTFITRTLYAEEWKKILGVQQLPAQMQQVMKIDSSITWPFADNANKPGLGILWGDYVVASTYVLNMVLGDVPPAERAQYAVQMSLLPWPGSGSSEKPEVFFEGTAELLFRAPSSHPTFYVDFMRDANDTSPKVDRGFGVFQRREPATFRYIPTPSGPPYATGTLQGSPYLQEFFTLTSLQRATGIDRIFYMAKDPVSSWHYVNGSFQPQDFGGPIFRMVNGKPQLVGILIDSGALSGYYGRGVALDINDFLNSIPMQLPR